MFLVIFNSVSIYKISYSIKQVKAKISYDRDEYTGSTTKYAYVEGYGEVDLDTLFEERKDAERYATRIVTLNRKLLRESAFRDLEILLTTPETFDV